MCATATPDETHEESSVQTAFVRGLKNDRDEDTRSCKQPDCHGSLKLTEEDIVVCHSCRCTPNGIYLSPEVRERAREDSNYTFTYTIAGRTREGGESPYNPYPSKGRNTDAGTSRERYDNSGQVICVGGKETVYNANDEVRPDSVGEEYTFDLSTL